MIVLIICSMIWPVRIVTSPRWLSIGSLNSTMFYLRFKWPKGFPSMKMLRLWLCIQEWLFLALPIKCGTWRRSTPFVVALRLTQMMARGLPFIYRLKNSTNSEVDNTIIVIRCIRRWMKGLEIQFWVRSCGKSARMPMGLSLNPELILLSIYHQ
jgi:hypothetical protein